jgi:D-alanyl-D-alanine carboxypeptidase/D-alanyl-D-alanine-endopeptidase (penicillin-binding protein 4)
MKNIFLSISAAAAMILCVETAAQTAGLQKSVSDIAADPALSEAVISICARSGDGRTLVDINAGNMVMPASNMKLITTGAALHSLGPDYRFKTSIGHDGEVSEGVLKGNLYIIGGGDPTLGSRDSIATEISKVFGEWEKMIREAGIRRIEGRIIGDGRWFDGMDDHPSWQWSDLGTYYGSGATGLMFHENTQSFSVSPGKNVGDPVNITSSYPDAPWMEFRYSCTTGKAGTGDRLYLYASDLAPVAEVRGTFGIDRTPKRLDCSNKFPEYTCASLFADYLKGKGIYSEGPADMKLCTDIVPAPSADLHILGSTSSPALKRIVYVTNHASNNLYAETLLRTLGKVRTGSACYDSTYVALDKVLAETGTDTTRGASFDDGSGLSRKNYISADFFCRFLASMMDSPCFEDYISTLPSPGSNGTLSGNMKSSSEETKARIKVKSGSMGGVRCYSGYVIPSEGCREETIIFSIMVNNCTAPSWKLRSLLDKIMAAFAAAN